MGAAGKTWLSVGLLALACGHDQRDRSGGTEDGGSGGHLAMDPGPAPGNSGGGTPEQEPPPNSGGSQPTSAVGGMLVTWGGMGGVDLGAAGSGGAGSGGAAVPEPPSAESLVGHYDVTIVDPELPAGCSYYLETNIGAIFEEQTHLNLSVESDSGALSARVGWDFVWSDFGEATLDGGRFTTASGTHGNTAELFLELEPEGFSGSGHLDVLLLCDGAFVPHRFSVTAGPDVTPPRVQIASPRGEPGRYFSHSAFAVRFSEALDVPWELGRTTWDASATEGSLGLRDTETGAALPVKWEASLFSGLAYMSLTDRMSMEGRSVVVETLGTAHDGAGLSWVADSTAHVLHPSGPTELEHDFSLEPAGLGNGAEYFPPGAAGSPCEAGGCVLYSRGRRADRERKPVRGDRISRSCSAASRWMSSGATALRGTASLLGDRGRKTSAGPPV